MESVVLYRDFTAEPEESDRLLGQRVMFYEEAGLGKHTKASRVTLAPCADCGTPVIEGVLDSGVHLVVEPHVLTYTLLWHSSAPYPRLTQSRGYPAHRCPFAPV